MVIVCIERKPEQLCVRDESQDLSDVVQNGLRTLRHRKDFRTKLAHPFVRVLGGPIITDFSPQSVQEFLSNENISIVVTVNFRINASYYGASNY